MIIKNDPRRLLIHQLKAFYGDEVQTQAITDEIYCRVIEKMDLCFSKIRNKYFHQDGENLFSALHTVQWTMFLYQMARTLFLLSPENRELCDQIYGISKMISSADLYYEVEMPAIWTFDHPQGSVMGRARYSNYFSFDQACTVGNNKGVYPTIGEYVAMKSGSKILGNSHVGDHVIMAANSYIIDTDIPS